MNFKGPVAPENAIEKENGHFNSSDWLAGIFKILIDLKCWVFKRNCVYLLVDLCNSLMQFKYFWLVFWIWHSAIEYSRESSYSRLTDKDNICMKYTLPLPGSRKKNTSVC